MINKVVKDYSEFFKGYKKQKYRYNFYKRIIKRLIKKGTFLDIGCAEGYFLQSIENRFITYGIELNKSASEKAKLISKKSRVFNRDATNLSNFKDNMFNVITIFDVLEHIKETNKILREIKRVIKENGVLIVSVPNTNSLGHRLKGKDWFGYRDKTHVSLNSPEKWTDYFQANGFKVNNIFYEGYFDIPYYNKFKLLQKVYLIPGMLMYLTGIRFIPKNGENVIFILKG